jgi:hypothetical protein
MKKLIKNKYIILLSVFLNTIFISLLYSLKNINLFLGNFVIVLITLALQALSTGFFLFMIESFIAPKQSFKINFLNTIKSVFISQYPLSFVSIALFIICTLTNISAEWISKIIITTTNQISLFALFLSYSLVTKKSFSDTIKVVSITIIIMMIVHYVFHFLA